MTTATTTATHPGTILHQQIGRRAFAMMGARDLLLIDGGLHFRLGAGARCDDRPVNVVRVTLAADDTYRVAFHYVRGVQSWTRAEFTGIYADQLRGLLERCTGFALSL